MNVISVIHFALRILIVDGAFSYHARQPCHVFLFMYRKLHWNKEDYIV